MMAILFQAERRGGRGSVVVHVAARGLPSSTSQTSIVLRLEKKPVYCRDLSGQSAK